MNSLLQSYFSFGFGVWAMAAAMRKHTFRDATLWSCTKGFLMAIFLWPIALIMTLKFPFWNSKEENKLIERTCKYDAYMAVYQWGKERGVGAKEPAHGTATWYAKEKMENHKVWLDKQDRYYDYATSTFVKKEKV